MTQTELAEMVGEEITQSDIARFEKGKRLPKLDIALRLATFFNSSVEELFPSLMMEIQETLLDMVGAQKPVQEAQNGPKILAIYPSTYRMGIAVFSAFTLQQQSVHKLSTGPDTIELLRRWSKVVSRLLKVHKPDVLVVEKLPSEGAKNHTSLKTFVSMIYRFADYSGILIAEYSIEVVRMRLLPKGARLSNNLLYQLVASQLPQLRGYLPCIRRGIGKGAPYFSALLLASALGLTWLGEHHTPYAPAVALA